MGCGPDNPHGLHVEVYRSADSVYADVTFDERHIGAPGLAHGGAVAAACDDVLGFTLWIAGTPAVTRSLTVGMEVLHLTGCMGRNLADHLLMQSDACDKTKNGRPVGLPSLIHPVRRVDQKRAPTPKPTVQGSRVSSVPVDWPATLMPASPFR